MSFTLYPVNTFYKVFLAFLKIPVCYRIISSITSKEAYLKYNNPSIYSNKETL